MPMHPLTRAALLWSAAALAAPSFSSAATLSLETGSASSIRSASASGQQAAQQQPAQQPPEQKPAEQQQDPAQDPDAPVTYAETVVVTASKIEQKLVDAPATMSVIRTERLETLPSQSYADVFRTVPGVNVTQTSARDVNLTSRSSTGTLTTSQLALLDGRSIYQDFFGFIAWDFLPVNFNEIKQIEVIRGPASAIWGANAMTGVINVITKTPREMQGTNFVMGFGGFERSADDPQDDLEDDSTAIFYVSGSHARAVNDRWAYKLSAGTYKQGPLSRPTGLIPGSTPPTSYPPFTNTGTTQPKFDARADYDFPDGRQKLVFSGGVAGTEGIIHTGIGPFDINSGTVLGYVKANYSRGALKANFFTNILNGEANALLAVGVDGRPILFEFKNTTLDFEFGNVQTIGTRHAITYGGNVRHNGFDLSIAPAGDSRNEVGGYIQDEIFLSDMFRWVIGARVDKFSVIDDAVFSPRTTFMIKPEEDQTFRLSFNRAYRSPSLVNNFLQTAIVNPLPIAALNPAFVPLIQAGALPAVYNFPTAAVGNEDLKEESMTAYEIGYSGRFRNRTTVSAAFYVNRAKNSIFFTVANIYTSAAPPPGFPPLLRQLGVLEALTAAGRPLPSRYTYLNLGNVTDRGFELGVDTLLTENINMFANYSYQADPDPEGFDISETNLPPNNRFNIGFGADYDRFLANLSVSYQDDAFWQDVLDARFHGPTEAYTQVNAGFGVRWLNNKVVTQLKITNLTNEDIQQHVFGDIFKRQIVGEIRASF